MILGFIGPDYCAYISAEIKVPRLNAEGTFYLQMDTGADNTSFHLRDTIQLLSKRTMSGSFEKVWGMIRKRFRLLGNPTPIDGVGGTATYLQEPAQIIFTHVDGTKQGFVFDLDIVKPANWGSRRFRQQLELPSLLGMDIMSQFRLVMNYPNNQIYLDNN
jgi:hypothetical protein